MLLVVLAWLAGPDTASAGPGAYRATRFDVAATVLAGGSLDVTETLTFDFQSGTFTNVYREVPAARTDGIEILDARMDGVPLPRGDGFGQVSITGRSRVRVEWRFEPTGPSTHSFVLHYVAHGVSYRGDDGRDVVRWRLLPSEHRYAIDESHSVITAGVAAAGPAAVESHRVGHVSSSAAGPAATIVATGISANGSLVAEIRYPSGAVVTAPPQWQQRHLSAVSLGTAWATGAVAVFVGGMLILLLARQGYDAPAGDFVAETVALQPPDRLPAALAATLAARGRTMGLLSMATLLDLADRGVLTVQELPRRFGARNYTIAQVAGKHELEGHELEALATAFGGAADDVPIARARGRLTRGGRRFQKAVAADLASRGLLDEARKAVHDRVIVLAVTILLVAGVLAIGAATLLPRYEAWPFLLPLALAVSGFAGLALAAATTTLSDAGLEQSARWRGFRRHLKSLAGARDDPDAPTVSSHWIVYGIALGLARPWSRYLKRHADAAPPWFVGAGNDDAGIAFAAFVGSHAAASSGGAAGAGAAGGGASGAG